MIYRSTLCAMLLLSASTLYAEQIYSVIGNTFPNLDGSGEVLPITGELVGDDLAGSLTGTISVGTVGDFLFDGALAALSPAAPAIGNPSIASIVDTASTNGSLTGVALNLVDFERSPLEPFNYEDLTSTWETGLLYFGTMPGNEGSRFGGSVSFVPVSEPMGIVTGLVGVALLGFRRLGMRLRR